MFSFKVLTNRLFINRINNTIKWYSSSTQLVTIENRDNIRLIGINRPERRNCVNRETATQLLNAFKDFDQDNSSVAAVLHGFGGTFCAGYDLQELSQANNQNIDLNDFIIRGPMV